MLESKRFAATVRLFEVINAGTFSAVVSLYAIQEIYSFCKKSFSPHETGRIARKALLELFQNQFELCGLLSREDRLLNRARFSMDDLSDQPHAISAYLNKCDAIITYDTHFKKIKSVIAVHTPEELIRLR